MKHPTSQQVLTVINNFKKVLPKAIGEDALDMMATNVCGTIHCHAGWYGVSVISRWRKVLSFGHLSFTSGAEMMAKDLGFESMEHLKVWAKGNDSIWGHYLGEGMFSSANAFYNKNKRPLGALNLQHIIDHWTEVYERLLALENQDKVDDIEIGKIEPTHDPIIERPFPADKIKKEYVVVKISESILDGEVVVKNIKEQVLN